MLNHITIMGRLTREPELRHTQSQTAVASFTLAVDRDFQSRDSGEKQTDFINCVAWRSTADFVSKYFHKGDPIGVEGSIQTREYEDKTGARRTAVEIVTDNVFFVGGRGGASQGMPAARPESSSAPVAYTNGSAGDFEEVETDNDLPF